MTASLGVMTPCPAKLSQELDALTFPSELLGTGMFGISAVASSCTTSEFVSGSSSSGYSIASLCLRSGEDMPSACSEDAGVCALGGLNMRA